MKTTVIESGKTANKVNNTAVNAKAENNGTQPKTNGLPLSKEFDDKPKGEAEAKKTETPAPSEQPKSQEAPKAETVQPQTEQPNPEAPKAEAEQQKAEPVKEVKEAPQKSVLNLESTLKLVEELHRRKIQRDRLLDTIDTLEAFEVAQIDDADETEANHFQGCVLTIEDDNRRKFTTKNPVIIQAVAQFVNSMCVNRLAEIEAGITIPA
ncbi:hypothetical protein [Mucilaginibacter sp.]|uniref:hypothetical protein n=1 Tax=Mucilaginibacter sp. TaxID=1882438 RepID=UPI000CAF0C7C|nr:hypothetical protein [Mucilaginibacter sp.]PLW88524.1 MAG: hypothetical protein C0154_16500 [Mucilaginibacter sp.]PMP66229.1 MAG: hypothetical protein C0191_01470 [Mucilaginibacter sp.]HEK22208.1 hypothetical protein [Bacteroidota bacterium]